MSEPAIEELTCNLRDALALCVIVESVAPAFGCHVALTGGALYKVGQRKDIDILLYRIRQKPCIDFDGLMSALKPFGIVKIKNCGWCCKAKWGEKFVDIFRPEEALDKDVRDFVPEHGKYPLEA